MSKLVLFLPDDSTLDIPLDRERLTIGRRAGNDVVLPNLAVSGEHAAIVTILADSFLEDLNSTNGTLVNTDPVAKHFLRDRDEIDIGRHKLIYCADDDAVIEPKKRQGRERIMDRDSGGRVQAAKPFVRGHAEKSGSSPEPAAAPEEPSVSRASRTRGPVSRATRPSQNKAEPIEVLIDPPEPLPEEPKAPVPIDPPPPDGPAIKIVSGVRTGKMIALTKAETTIGRPGVQVAAIIRMEKDFHIKPLEGVSPPLLNGQPIGPGGADLVPGDVVEVVATRVQLVDSTVGSPGPDTAETDMA